MKKVIKSIVGFLFAVVIVIEIAYAAIANSITDVKIRESIKDNLLTGLIYDAHGNRTEIFNTILRLTKLDEETVVKLMENETADNIITDIVDSIYDYNLTGDASVKYTGEEIINIVDDNMDKVLSEIDYHITASDREEVMEYTRNNTDYILDTIYSTDIGDYKK